MGTTRMSADPAEGVVTADCNVFGYDNLYVAGSSVFCTSGWANPTLTLAALALRLADHLDDRLKERLSARTTT
jgi:choline dehydrogenase-like flavoprotein